MVLLPDLSFYPSIKHTPPVQLVPRQRSTRTPRDAVLNLTWQPPRRRETPKPAFCAGSPNCTQEAQDQNLTGSSWENGKMGCVSVEESRRHEIEVTNDSTTRVRVYLIR